MLANVFALHKASALKKTSLDHLKTSVKNSQPLLDRISNLDQALNFAPIWTDPTQSTCVGLKTNRWCLKENHLGCKLSTKPMKKSVVYSMMARLDGASDVSTLG